MKILRYIEWLIKLVEEERKREIETMKKEIKSLSGRKREELGRAVLNLKGRKIKREFEWEIIRFEREKKIETEISVGDLVIVSKGNPLKSNLIGLVTEKGKRYLCVALKEVPKWALKTIRVDLFANDITFRRQIETLREGKASVINALKFSLKIKTPKKPYRVTFEPIDKGLNESQKNAVGLALGCREFFLIHGPFGTGKTRTLCEIILQFADEGKRILACAESNVSVDNLVERLYQKTKIVRLGHPSRVAEDLKKTTLFWQIENSKGFKRVKRLREKANRLILEKRTFVKPIPSLKRGLSAERILHLAKVKKTKRGLEMKEIDSMAKWIKIQKRISEILKSVEAAEEKIAREVLEQTSVVLCTNSSAGLELIRDMKFDVAVLDESTQSTIPSVLIPISKAGKFILAGDHKQLPPTLLSEKAKPLSLSLFERLIKNFPENSSLLNVQYRMNKILMEFPNREFYGGKLKSASSVEDINIKDLGAKDPSFGDIWDDILAPQNVLCFLDTSNSERKFEVQKRGSFSRENPFEVELVEKLIERLFRIDVRSKDIGIITPYEDQLDLLRMKIREGVEINTVDGFQGREKEIIIISFVRSSEKKILGFLSDLRRLNTAITRAKRKLILIGDAQTLSSHQVYRRFIDFIKKKGTFIQI